MADCTHTSYVVTGWTPRVVVTPTENATPSMRAAYRAELAWSTAAQTAQQLAAAVAATESPSAAGKTASAAANAAELVARKAYEDAKAAVVLPAPAVPPRRGLFSLRRCSSCSADFSVEVTALETADEQAASGSAADPAPSPKSPPQAIQRKQLAQNADSLAEAEATIKAARDRMAEQAAAGKQEPQMLGGWRKAPATVPAQPAQTPAAKA